MKKTNQTKVTQQPQGNWQCVSGCGACCNLTPADRPDLEEYLNPEELQLYLSMVGSDGWCINYDRDNRQCQIYDQRPRFCRVKPDNFADMYGVELAEFNNFAIACCQQQIIGVYGSNSNELKFYENTVFTE